MSICSVLAAGIVSLSGPPVVVGWVRLGILLEDGVDILRFPIRQYFAFIKELLIQRCYTRASSTAYSLRSLAGISSGPVALLGSSYGVFQCRLL